jgi:1,4-alpha-glucan branching enzyme
MLVIVAYSLRLYICYMAMNKEKHGKPSPLAIAANGHVSLFSEYDIELFQAGWHYRLYDKLGAHTIIINDVAGTYFAVWAPNAKAVAVTGNFNDWDKQSHAMHIRWDSSGIWELFIPALAQGAHYKYHIAAYGGYSADKADPYGVRAEPPPATASVVCNLDFEWTDSNWMAQRKTSNWQHKPMSIYEVHIGSWKRTSDKKHDFLSYRELAEQLPGYCKELGFTHVELMPVMEHPYYASWGYQITGYFAPSSQYGTPQDFMHLIDALHNAGISVILDWVPSHFPSDEHGLGYFDGTHLYEHENPQKGFHPEWKSFIFNYARNEVRGFLISNALYWLDKYHIDGLRVDAVSSILYLDYMREPGEWEPNEYGGRENLEAAGFLKEFNEVVHKNYPDVITIAEESSAWPGVTHPVSEGGLGFDLKWMMGWMHDTLKYFSYDPAYRGHHQDKLTFNIHYVFDEKFVLPLSHDEVVYGKRSMINKMPGDSWQKFANLRLLYGYMYGSPGAKLIFMGSEFAQNYEWQHDYALDWHNKEGSLNAGIWQLLADLNALYKLPEVHENNFSCDGFKWIDFNDQTNSAMSWLRKAKDGKFLLFICNFTPVVQYDYLVGVPKAGAYKELLNTDSKAYGGSGVLNVRPHTLAIAMHGQLQSLSVALPPLGMVVLQWVADN